MLRNKSILLRLPLLGIGVFLLLYLLSAAYYPGGNQHNLHEIGFSWLHNYWCNLLNLVAANGAENSARPFALLAMFVICLSIALFWYLFPNYVCWVCICSNRELKLKRIVQISGLLSMFVGLFVFTNFHDLVIDIAGFFGVIAAIGTFVGLKKLKWNHLIWFGVLNLMLIAINNVLYYGGWLYYLPVVQKVTFLGFLSWIGLIDWKILDSNYSK
jgi:hypothetical protein